MYYLVWVAKDYDQSNDLSHHVETWKYTSINSKYQTRTPLDGNFLRRCKNSSGPSCANEMARTSACAQQRGWPVGIQPTMVRGSRMDRSRDVEFSTTMNFEIKSRTDSNWGVWWVITHLVWSFNGIFDHLWMNRLVKSRRRPCSSLLIESLYEWIKVDAFARLQNWRKSDTDKRRRPSINRNDETRLVWYDCQL